MANKNEIDYTRLIKICSITKSNDETILKDCNDKKVLMKNKNEIIYYHNNKKDNIPLERLKKTRYFYTINNSYREKHNNLNNNKPVVWVLIGKTEEDEVMLQVGRNSSSNNMLKSDIDVDARYIIEGGDNKYSKLNYEHLTFYQVDINSFIEEKEQIYAILNNKYPNDNNLKIAYESIKSAYVEGKVASLYNANLWNPSGGLDKLFYNYFSNSKKYGKTNFQKDENI